MKQQKKALVVWIGVVLVLLIAALLAGSPGREGVSSGLVFAFTVTAVLLIAAVLIRVFAIPRLRYQPGKLQLLLEGLVGFFTRLGEGLSRLCRGLAKGVGCFFRGLFHGLFRGLPKGVSHLCRGLLNACVAAAGWIKQHGKKLAIWVAVILLLLAGSILISANEQSWNAQGAVNLALIASFAVTAALLAAAVLIRVFAIPRLQYRPGKLQLLLEEPVGFIDRLAKGCRRRLHALSDRPAKVRSDRHPLRGLLNACMAAAGWARRRGKELAVWLAAISVLLAGSIAVGTHERSETVQEAMRDAVLHDVNRISLFGLKAVNPGLVAAFVVTAVLLAAAVLLRIFAVPRFRRRQGKLQLLLEEVVGLFDGLARGGSPWRYGFMSAYIFAVGLFIFVGTLFELLGLQAITIGGHSITLPAPLSDVNAAIATGTLSYLVILSGGIAGNGVRGVGKTLKEFSLPISMSFRLFGALLSGLLVTELVYYYVNLSFVLPVVVGVLFTLLHAIIQTYVLTMLTSMYYGEVSEPPHEVHT